MFSFVKELDDEAAKLLKSLSDRQGGWRRSPGVVVWAFWIGDDREKAKAWAARHHIDGIVFGVVSPNDAKLAEWNIHPTAKSTHVLACRRKRAMAVHTNVKGDEVEELEARLAELLKSAPRD